MNPQSVCLHNPYTGGHYCGGKVPKWARAAGTWVHGLNKIEAGDGGEIYHSDMYLTPGAWCCALPRDRRDVTCPDCLELIQKNGLPRRAPRLSYGGGREHGVPKKYLRHPFVLMFAGATKDQGFGPMKLR